MADAPEVFATDTAEAGVQAVIEHGEAGTHVEPELWGLAPYQIVAWAMLILILIAVWKKVPAMIVSGLDSRIAAIRDQLDEAKKLRGEAEALRNEYSAKIANAEKDAEAMLAHARKEADAIVGRAEADGKAMIERRQRMAEDKIASAERQAVGEVRARAAAAAAAASRKLISAKHNEAADRRLADELIAGL